MGIVELKVYTIECDLCSKDLFEQNEQYKGIGEKDALDDEAETSEWEKIGEKYFCPDCWKWSDDGEIVSKN